jgi:hypothetical protein
MFEKASVASALGAIAWTIVFEARGQGTAAVAGLAALFLLAVVFHGLHARETAKQRSEGP